MYIVFRVIEYLPYDLVRWDGTFMKPLLAHLVLYV